jgi:transposase
MLSLASSSRIFIHSLPTDMRKSFDALCGIVKAEFQKDILDGDYFVFFNRVLDRCKILLWDRDGLILIYKSQESEDPHFNIFTRVEIHRTFNGIVDETRSTCF